jgi:peptidylprolyl isomerase
MVFLALAGCVSRVGPAASSAQLSDTSQPPARSPLPWECGTDDITVTGTLAEKPVVTVPTDCRPPTTLLARDLIVGTGPKAVVGSDLEVNYVMITWSDGESLDSTWSGTNSLPLSVMNLGNAGWGKGWDDGLPGIRQGGRRLLVIPPDYRETNKKGDTLVYVIDAVKVS